MAKTSGSHAHRHHHGSRKPPLCADNDSPDRPHFKCLKPRVGSQYQTRVPKMGNSLSCRPAPEKMSTEQLTALELQNEQPMDKVSSSSSMPVGYGPMHYELPPTVRGGLCVHRPSDDCDHLVLSKKRKVTASVGPTRKRACPDDEHFLQYLTMRHQGNVETAQLSLLVASSAGRAYQARRCLHKQDHIERFRRPPIASSQSWIQRLDRSCPTESIGFSNDGSSSKDMKRVWKAVLARGQEMGRELDKLESKPLLSQVLAFCYNARSLSIPEESYGTRHIVVDGISECMHAILDHVSKAHDAQAKLFDMLYDEENEGVDIDSLRKYIEELKETLSIRLDEMDVLEKQLDLAADWQARMDGLAGDSEDRRDELKAAEELLQEASMLGIRWRGQVQLENRVEEAYQLRDRLREWQESCAEKKKVSVKFVAGLVRDANRLNLNFPEASKLIEFHQTSEAWVDRANVAIRSRISLMEIESLIDRGEKMPLDLSEFLDKLQFRVRLSQCWLSDFQDLVPAPFSEGKMDNLAWMSRMREALQSDDKSFLMQLHDMATEGTRIPVEIDCVKQLLVEIDAKNWSLKAKKWITIKNGASGDSENVAGGKRAKLVDIRDHLTKAVSLREKLVLPPVEREAWVLEGEAELKSIIEAADDWFEQYQEYLEYDNRRNTERSCLSIATLRQIVDEGNLIYANIGSASSKMSRILGQAESWYGEFGDLLVRSGVSAVANEPSSTVRPNGLVTLEEIKAAVESAASNVSLDLDEALALKNLGERIQKWQDQVLVAAPTRSKRVGKGKRQHTRFSVDDLRSLIDEAQTLPIKTDEDVQRLRHQLSHVHEWRLGAQHELGQIATGFRTLRQAVNSAYGLPHEFNDVGDREAQNIETDEDREQQQPVTDDSINMSVDTDNDSADAQQTAEDSSQTETSSIAESELDTMATSRMGGGGSALYKTISSLLESSKLTGIRTIEEEVIEILEKVAKWILRSLKCIDAPKEVYEKKTFRPFDEFVETGDELLAIRDSLESGMELDDADLIPSLSSSWRALLSDQLVRLKALQSHRDEFVAWSKNAHQLLSSKENRATLEALSELAEQSYDYPGSSDMVQKVRHAALRAAKWREVASALLDSDERPTMQEAKDLFEEGEKLNLECEELKMLRTAIRSARGWAVRVKRCKIDQGGSNSNNVSKLINEYDSLLISMPEEFSRLNQVIKGYCLCRQPYDGFMIGCDGCSEWYHGPCIGVSESQADRCNKFLCVRCCLQRAFKSSADEIASTIRKWTDPKELKNARTLDAQKHQRKIRKEKRDIEKLAIETESLANELNEWRLKATSGTEELQAEDGVPVSPEGFPVSPSSRESVINDEDVLRPTMSAEDHLESVSNDLEDSKAPEAENMELTVELDHSDGTKLTGALSNEAALTRVREIERQLSKAAESVKASKDRIAALTVIANERKQIEDREDEKRVELRKWCIRIRSLVLVPSTTERAVSSQPSSDGSLSAPMLQVLRDAATLGIGQLPVVAEVENAFKCIAWCCLAMTILARKPSFSEMCLVVSKCESLKLPEEKSVRMMKSMLQRARFWHSKVEKALAPRPGESKPVNIDTMKGLIEAASDIPLSLPGKSCLQNVIDDKGMRYCICGGPHYGSFMLGCDKCDRWYHGRCVQVDKEEGDALDNWLCPPCQGTPVPSEHTFSIEDLDITDDEDDMSESDVEEDIATHAPIPEKLWPPYGLIQTQAALDMLGEECCAIGDDVDVLVEDSSSQPPTGNASMICTLPFVETEATPQAEMVDAPSLDLDKETETTAVVTTDPLDASDLKGSTVVSDVTPPASDCVPMTVTSDEHGPCTNCKTIHRDTGVCRWKNIREDENAKKIDGVAVALNVREEENSTKLYPADTPMIDYSLSNSDTIMNGASVLMRHSEPDVANGHSLALSVNASIMHNALPAAAYEYATGVQMDAAIARVAPMPGAYSIMTSLVNGRSSAMMKQDQADLHDGPIVEESMSTNGFDGIMAETMVTVPDNTS